jgi:uncharacterized heparinase superfamily protein
MIDAMTFRFLNETRRIGIGWEEGSQPQLWRYNLHYFDDLNAVGADARRAWHAEAIRQWIRDNPIGKGDGWAPFPTSLRIVNWIKYAASTARLETPAAQSLAPQVRFLSRRLEYHLLGNHLFANAKALCFAGLFFEGEEARRWLDKGLAILAREIPEQILRDGGQFERSTMYHALALEDVLDLINVTNAFPDAIPGEWKPLVASWPDVALRMATWLSTMCHPDGEISFFNDAATGVAPPPSEIFRYAEELSIHPDREGGKGTVSFHHLDPSGYIRAEAPNASLFIDVAPIGPDYLPGHAHADTLSFELSVFGQRVIVNTGTSRYGGGPEREMERGTRAHSTVMIDGMDSSEVWGGFRVARRARPLGLAVVATGDKLEVSCAHDGYRRLRGKPDHVRKWTFEPGKLTIEDRIEGRFSSAAARFHLHPHVRCSLDDGATSGRLWFEGGPQMKWTATKQAQLEDGFYCPEFGRRDAAKCLVIPFDDAAAIRVELIW